MVGLEGVLILHAGEEDEIQVRALRITVRHVRRDDGVRQRVADLAHVGVHLLHVRPVDRALERVGRDAEVHERVAQVGVVEAALFPAAGDVAGQRHAAVFERNFCDVARDVAAVALLTVGKAEEEAALHVLVAELVEQRLQRRLVDVVELEHEVGLFRVGQTEHGRVAALALHHLAGGLHGRVPRLEDVGESLAVLRHPAEDAQRDLGQHAERALGAHHDLVQVRAGGLAGVVAGLDGADGRGVLLAEDDVGDGAVIRAVLARAARDRPAADARILERLREVAAGVLPLGAEELRRALERLFQIGAGHAGLHGDGLVDLVEADDLVEVAAHIQRDAALDRLDAAGDAAAAAVDVQRDVVLGGVGHDLLDLLGRLGVKHNVGHAVDAFVAQTQQVVGRGAVGHAQTVVVRGGDILLADDLFERLDVLGRELHRVIGQIHGVKAGVVGICLEIVVRHLELLFHEGVEGLFRIFEEVRVAPAEDGAVAVRRRGGEQPFRLESFVRFVAHCAILLLTWISF